MFLSTKGDQNQSGRNGNINQVDTLIGNTASIKGDITSAGNVRVDGNFNGNIDSKNEVLIGEDANVVGNITAKAIIIFGKLKGNIKCEGTLDIMPSGKLFGDIVVKSVSIKEGAVFQGKCVMTDEKEEKESEEETENVIAI